MSGSFAYTPRFVDIRVRPPRDEPRVEVPETALCDRVGCPKAGVCKAPKARDRLNEFWFFCEAHAGEYNRNWNFFAGMSDDEFAAWQQSESVGHRPTWDARKGPPLNGAYRKVDEGRFGDVHGMFRDQTARRTRAEPTAPRRSKLQLTALEILGLEGDATPEMIRSSYAELVKKYHPDSNGGDRTFEAQLVRVVKAWKALKQAGLV
jgi:hypothetical protein